MQSKRFGIDPNFCLLEQFVKQIECQLIIVCSMQLILNYIISIFVLRMLVTISAGLYGFHYTRNGREFEENEWRGEKQTFMQSYETLHKCMDFTARR